MTTDLKPAAEAVMAQHDEETTGSVALDNLINAAMAHDCGDTLAAATRRAEAAEQQRDAETNRAFEHAKTIDDLRMERTAAACDRDIARSSVEALDARLATTEAERDQLAAQLREATTNVERLAAQHGELRAWLAAAQTLLETGYVQRAAETLRDAAKAPNDADAVLARVCAHERVNVAEEIAAGPLQDSPVLSAALAEHDAKVAAPLHAALRDLALYVRHSEKCVTECLCGMEQFVAGVRAALATSAAESDAFVAGVRRAAHRSALEKCAEAVDMLASMSSHPNTVAGIAAAVRGWAKTSSPDDSLAPASKKTETK